MQHIYAVGETVLDIIFKNKVPMTAKPGGSSFNAAITMGRLGLPVTFISELGDDKVGDIIVDFLDENHVGSKFVSRYDEGKTAIALAFLNDSNDAEYQFYKDYPHQRLNIEFPAFEDSDYLLFGSFYALNPGIRPRIKLLLKQAEQSQALILYDPNFRDSHLQEREQLLDVIRENMNYAAIVRASDEDLRNIFGAMNPVEAWEYVGSLCSVLIYTANAHGIHIRTKSVKLHIGVDSIEPLSTIGAGDTFNAGLLYELHKRQIRKGDLDTLDSESWRSILQTAAEFSKEVCLSYENYLPVEFVKKFSNA